MTTQAARQESQPSVEDWASFWQLHADDAARYQLLRSYRGKSVYRFEMHPAAGVEADASGASLPRSIIVKTWHGDRGPFWRRIKRRWFGERSGCDNEFGMLGHLQTHAPVLAVPTPIACFSSHSVVGAAAEVALMEDLGDCEALGVYLGQAVREGNAAVVARIEAFVVDSVRALLLDAKVIDIDHSIVNMVRAPHTDTLHRIDFEVAQHAADCARPDRAIGDMLGRLLATHVFACQPDVATSERLALRLRQTLPALPQAVWSRAAATVNASLARQRRRTGIDTQLDLQPTLR